MASSSNCTAVTNSDSFDLDCLLSMLDDGFFDCDDEINEAAKSLDAEITDELNSTEAEVIILIIIP